MGFSADYSGFDRLRREIETKTRPENVKAADLFNPQFMRRHTRWSSFEAMFQEGGFQTDEDLLDRPRVDAFVAQHTKFRSFQEMIDAAGAEYYKRKLGLG